MRTPNFKWVFVIAGLLVAAMLAWCLWPPVPQPVANDISPTQTTNGFISQSAWNERLRDAAKDLKAAPDATGKDQSLVLLKQALASGSTNEVSLAIRKTLDSKMDAPTGKGFKIGSQGFLSEAPTLRTLLLDHLGRIDPRAAAEYAKAILSSKDSPDEWALALRNLALGDTSAEAHALLVEKTGELLGSKDSQQNPSVGYLEAFDTAVYLGGTGFVPTLTGLVSVQDNPAIAHAAFLTLDRLVINEPAAMLSALLAQPGLMQGREQARAGYFARADVSDPRQLDLVQNYLLNAQTSADELQQFAGIFPNGNFMISQNLLTPSPTLNQAEIKRRDAESLKIVQQWLVDPRFARVRPELEKIQARLQEFVRQAGLQQ